MLAIFFFFHNPSHVKPAEATKMELLRTFDVPGILIIVASLICFFLALEWGGVTKPWGSSDVIGLLVGWALLVVLFVFVEWRQGERALVVPRILNQRTIAACCAFLFWEAPWIFSSFAFVLIIVQSELCLICKSI
jgi:hypothetical protein